MEKVSRSWELRPGDLCQTDSAILALRRIQLLVSNQSACVFLDDRGDRIAKISVFSDTVHF
jgi:hypothetical protein